MAYMLHLPHRIFHTPTCRSTSEFNQELPYTVTVIKHLSILPVSLPSACLQATVLIETLPAAFEMDEILFELREHSAGLNCGRWDYIFSFIKTLRADPKAVMPDR